MSLPPFTHGHAQPRRRFAKFVLKLRHLLARSLHFGLGGLSILSLALLPVSRRLVQPLLGRVEHPLN